MIPQAEPPDNIISSNNCQGVLINMAVMDWWPTDPRPITLLFQSMSSSDAYRDSHAKQTEQDRPIWQALGYVGNELDKQDMCAVVCNMRLLFFFCLVIWSCEIHSQHQNQRVPIPFSFSVAQNRHFNHSRVYKYSKYQYCKKHEFAHLQHIHSVCLQTHYRPNFEYFAA